jgi:hypothetical protein
MPVRACAICAARRYARQRLLIFCRRLMRAAADFQFFLHHALLHFPLFRSFFFISRSIIFFLSTVTPTLDLFLRHASRR